MQTNKSNPEKIALANHAAPARIIILADDLTGACDSGVAFLASGRRVRVILDSASPFQPSVPSAEEEVWSFTTESRNLTVNEATARLIDRMSQLPHHGSLFFKKIDSAARGHLGAEVVAALRSSGAAIALVAPAFPQAGRTVHEGVLRISDFSGQDATIPLLDLFATQPEVQVDLLDEILPEHLSNAIAQGTGILLCGARTQHHLHQLAAAGLALDQPILWAGSAGLAHALAGELPPVASSSNQSLPSKLHIGNTLLFTGTPHPVTRLQISRLDPALHRMHAVNFDPTSSENIRSAFRSEPVAALILTGGDTAAFVLHALGASAITLLGEVSRGIPWGIVQGGLADGRMVVTKSGGFGDPEALIHAFDFCHRRSCETT